MARRKKPTPPDAFERAEAIRILVEIARTGPATARIAAIKQLEAMAEDGERAPAEGFDKLG